MRNFRAYLIIVLLTLLFAGMLLRLYSLQLLGHERFTEMARRQHHGEYELHPQRGTIYDRFMEPFAVDLKVKSVFCDPNFVKNPEEAAEKLSSILHMDREELLRRLTSERSFVWLRRKIPSDMAGKISGSGVRGVFLIDENKRNYPHDGSASHILGFAGIDNQGLAGLELFYDEKLRGEPGWRYLIRDAARRAVWVDEERSVPPRDGLHMVLTLDSVMQFIVERELKNMVEEFNPGSASIVVMDPKTGRVLAMASYPSFDPNEFGRYSAESWRNIAVSDVYEPGSVFKVFSAAAVLEEGEVGPDDLIHCENGSYSVGGRVLKDFRPHGELTFEQVIARSSNIGTVKAAMAIGKDKLYEYIRAFGFAERTGIDLPGEASGILRPPHRWSRSDITTVPMGQGVAVTSVQLAAAVSAVANGGVLMRPYVVDRLIAPDGATYKQFSPRVRRRVISRETALTLSDILHSAVETGTGRHARSNRYKMCGKTGTAQVPSPQGGYYEDRYVASFIGFAPKDDPVIAVAVAAYDPKPVYFGGNVAAPTFKRLAESGIEYMMSMTNSSRSRVTD